MMQEKKSYSQLSNFKEYIQKKRWYLLIFNGLLFLVWMPWMQQVLPRIDTEELLLHPYSPNNWLEIGRQGGIFTRWIFGIARFNPLFSIIGGYLLICVASIIFGYLFSRAAGADTIPFAAFGLICFTCPIMAEQFYFDMQIFLVAWAYILCAVSVGLSYYGILKKKPAYCLAAVIGMLWTFCTYQIFVVLYVVTAVTCFVLLYQRWTLGEQRQDPPYWQLVGGLIAMFLSAFAVNMIISNAFFLSSDYLDSQIAWGKVPAKQNFQFILSHIKAAVLGEGTFYTPLYGVFAVAAILSVLVQVFRRRIKLGWLAVLAVLGLQTVPFLLTFYLGIEPAIRAQLAYPMVLACDVVILLRMIPENRLIRGVVCLLTILLCWTQTLTTTQLIYTDQVRAQEDMRLAAAIEQRIIEVSDLNKPIAVVGVYKNQLNAACIRGVIVGMSAFNCNSNVKPHYARSTRRACELSQTYGFPFISASAEQVFLARKQAVKMPCWPAGGSVADAGEYTIVKLSEDNWPEEIMEPFLNEFTAEEGAVQLLADDSL